MFFLKTKNDFAINFCSHYFFYVTKINKKRLVQLNQHVAIAKFVWGLIKITFPSDNWTKQCNTNRM